MRARAPTPPRTRLGATLVLSLASLASLASLVPLACGDSGDGTATDAATAPSSTGESEGATTGATTSEATSDGATTGATTDGASCPGQTPEAVMGCVEQPRYEEDLGFIADIRVPGSAHWQAVQDLCADRLSELGFDVTLHDYGLGVNVIGVRPGSVADGPRVLVTAHYDHIPNCSGADDNATGVAGILEIARVLADVPTPNTLVVACWDQEEIGLVGSRAYADEAAMTGEPIAAVFNFDMIGVKSDEPNSQNFPAGFDLLFPDDFAVLEGNEFRADFVFWVSDDGMAAAGAQFEAMAASIGLPTIGEALSDELKSLPALSDLRRSDHAGFWDQDIPAMFVTDSSNFRYPSYHCMDGNDDVLENLDHEFATQVVRATAGAAAVSLGL
ncbi:MAG: M20/M25/M40 family metallo-hydrolase [Myxococcales bacterium]|nr:M20/M25/M40 family metallo-hydrolase [Myxococcales bacterium]MCB9752299.1 M20/M25/M40 family metallo-hydrolase [Myxococcales bacterium]